MANNDSGWSFAKGFFMGAVVGAVAGILLAPKSGVETRANIIEQSQAWRERAEEMAAKVREKVGPTVEGARERVASRARRRPPAASEAEAEEEQAAETTES